MSKKTCGAEEARASLPELLDRAHHGASTVITKRGRPYAAIVPLSERGGSGRSSLLTLRGSGKGLWGARPASAVAKLRDEWE